MMQRIEPIFQKKNAVPVVFSANQAFVPVLAVMLQSIIEQSSQNYTYDVIILSRDINSTYEKRLQSMIKEHNNFSLRVIDVSEYFKQYTLYIANRPDITVETYFRLIIPELMTEYEKVLYLDGDMIANADVAELLETEIDNSLVAACIDCDSIGRCHHGETKLKEYRKKVLKLEYMDRYFCAGVLVMNLKRFRERFDSKHLLEIAASYDWLQHDQDVLNMVCNQEVKLIPVAWDLLRDAGSNQYMPESLYKEFLAAERDPKIVHYGGKRKPWIYFDVERGEYFWRYAGKTPFYREILSMVNVANQQRHISNGTTLITEDKMSDAVLMQFVEGKVGMRYIIKYLKAWFKFKVKRGRA